MPSDKEYIATKQIMLGKANMNPDFVELANFINQTFNVKPINILYDTIDKEKRPRLNICFEFEKEKQSFNKNSGNFNFDDKKQKVIADKFRQTLMEQKSGKHKDHFNFLKKSNEKYKTDNIWVDFSAFEPVARIEANENVPQNKVAQLKEELNNEDLWEISRCFSGITFFLYTDQQVKEYKSSHIRKLWTCRYFDLLEPYNEFGYLKRDKFNVYLDSKENFDNNYASNWFYYYR